MLVVHLVQRWHLLDCHVGMGSRLAGSTLVLESSGPDVLFVWLVLWIICGQVWRGFEGIWSNRGHCDPPIAALAVAATLLSRWERHIALEIVMRLCIEAHVV